MTAENDNAPAPGRAAKAEKTPEDAAAVAYLDALRSPSAGMPPARLPLACVVKVTESEDVPKAHEAYSMVRVEGQGGQTWRLCVRRKTVKTGKNALFVSDDAALPPEDARFRNPAVCTAKEKVYKPGPGVGIRRLLPHVKRNIYRYNCGVLYPLDAFAELRGKRAGFVCAALLGIDSRKEIVRLAQGPRADVFIPGRACGGSRPPARRPDFQRAPTRPAGGVRNA